MSTATLAGALFRARRPACTSGRVRLAVGPARLLLFVAGAASLAGQVTWSRLAAAAVGGTLASAAIVLSAAMAGLAAGGALAAAALGRWNPRALLSRSILACGVTLAAMPWLLLQVSRAEGSLALRCLLAGILLGLAHVPFGAILPCASEWRGGRTTSSGQLYAIGCLGAVLGALGVGEVLSARLALDHIGILLGVAVVIAGLLLVRSGAEEPAVRGAERGRLPRRAAVVAFGLGLLGLAAEFLWLQVLGFAWGANTATYALVTASTVGGLCAGSIAAGRIASWQRLGRPGIAAGIGLSALALAAAALLSPAAAGAFTSGERMALAFPLVGGPAFCFGATFVLLLGEVRGGRPVGLLSAANSAGAALAPLLLWAASQVGPWPPRMLIVVACGCALLILATAVPRGICPALLFASAVGLGGWGWAPAGPSAADYHPGVAPSDFGATVLPFVHAGPASTVAVSRDTRTGVEILWIDRGMQGDTSPLGRRIPLLLGRLPCELLGRPPRRAMVVGLGTGLTLRGVVEGGAREVEVAELSAGVIEANRTILAEANGRVLERSEVKVRHADGRPVLADAEAPYDLVVTDMVFPTAPGAGNLFSREFYALARRRLTPDGLFVHWLPCFLLSPADLSSVCAAFLESFPEGSAWIGFLGAERLILGLAGGAVGAAPPYRLALGPAGLRELAGGADPIRDADPRLEVRSRRVPGDGSFGRENLLRLLPHVPRAWRLFAEAGLADDPVRALALYREAAAAAPGATDAEFFLESGTYERELQAAQGAAARGDEEGLLGCLRRAAAHPLHGAGNLHLADALAARGRFEEAARALEKSVAKSPRSADAHLKLAFLACALRDTGRARKAFEAACALRPDRPPAYLEAARFLR